MNLSERLAQAAVERRRQPESSAPRVPFTSVDPEPNTALLPDRVEAPVNSGRVAVMKMRLPESTSTDTAAEPSIGLPLWQRPFADVMRDAPLATVTSLPIQLRDNDAIDEDLDGAELAQTIPMPGIWMPTVGVDDLPPLASSESHGLAGGALRSEQDGHRHHEHLYLSDQVAMIDLDDVAIDAEIVLDGPSADALLDRWSESVIADVHDRQEKVDDLYQRMVDITQHPRITFGPIDLRDEIVLPHAEEPAPLFRFEAPVEVVLARVDDEHTCPQCGATARVDIHDPLRGRIHLSCDNCFKMWQERVESTVDSDEPFMRD